MDIKDLNKPQLIMLALLLSFVTSIATGITTVTLMQQAPPSVTVPINRVVKETVEKIVQVPGKNTVQTVVIKEEDLVVDAIAKNKTASFAIMAEAEDENGNDIEVGTGRGFAVSKEGLIVVDGSLVNKEGVYYVLNDNGKFKADFVPIDSSVQKGFAFLKIGEAVGETKKEAIFTVPDFGDLSKIRVGQKILLFGDSISSFIFEGGENLKISGTKPEGGEMVFDLDGKVLGIALSGGIVSFATTNAITEALDTVKIAQ